MIHGMSVSTNNLESKSLRSGYGVQYYPDNSSYTGYWRNDKWDGQGRAILTKHTAVWEGMWSKNEFTGWGNSTYANGSKRSGQWRAGRLQGLGYIQKPSKQLLGTFNEGVMEGLGLQYANASSYSVGKWSNGQLVGPGIEISEGHIRLIGDSPSTEQKFWTNSTLELCLRRQTEVHTSWEISSNGTQVEAVTF